MYIFFISIPFIVIPILLYIRLFNLMVKMQKSDIVKAVVVNCENNQAGAKKKYRITYEVKNGAEKQTHIIESNEEHKLEEIQQCYFFKDTLSKTGYIMIPAEKLDELQSPKKNILLLFSGVVFVLSLCFAINTIYVGFANIAFQVLMPLTSLVMFVILLHNIQIILDKRTMVLGPSTIAFDAKIIGNERRLHVDTGKFLYHPIYEYEYKNEIRNYVDKKGVPTRQPKEKRVVLYYSPVRKQFMVQENIKENVIAACISGAMGLVLIVVFLLLLFI